MAEEEEEIMIMEEKEKMSITTATITVLPQDILMDILSRIPVETLLNSFKLVCKPWCTLIKDPVFIKIHLSRRSINGATANNSLICKSSNELFQLYPPFSFEGIPPSTDKAPKNLEFDTSLCLKTSLVSSCNGLLCLRFDADDNIILLNPSTRKYKLPPKQPIEFPSNPSARKVGPATFGFGCSSIDDEYKVIRIAFFSGLDDNLIYHSQYEFDIYSMSSNSWRRETRYANIAYVISEQQSGVFVNGALHWVARYTQTRIISSASWDTILSFDIKDEKFGLVPIPLSSHPTEDDPCFKMKDVILMNMKGCLSMIRVTDANDSYIDFNLETWVMKEYGIKESWTKEFVIKSSDSYPPRALSGFTISWFSNAFVLKGDQILIEGLPYTYYSIGFPKSVKLVLFDINERKIDGDFKRTGVPVPVPYETYDDFLRRTYDDQDDYFPCSDQVDYIETLVSLKSSLTSIEH